MKSKHSQSKNNPRQIWMVLIDVKNKTHQKNYYFYFPMIPNGYYDIYIYKQCFWNIRWKTCICENIKFKPNFFKASVCLSVIGIGSFYFYTKAWIIGRKKRWCPLDMNLGMCIKEHGHNSYHFQTQKKMFESKTCDWESVIHKLQKNI